MHVRNHDAYIMVVSYKDGLNTFPNMEDNKCVPDSFSYTIISLPRAHTVATLCHQGMTINASSRLIGAQHELSK